MVVPSPTTRQSPAGSAEAGVVTAVRVAPFICHSSVPPPLVRHAMSALPSPVKSPTAPTVQPAGALADSGVVAVAVAPFISQRLVTPVVGLRHRMSDLPSPLKSPTPAICHGAPSWFGSIVVAVAVTPFIVHRLVSPAPWLRHRMSALPSPLKSPTPAMLQLGSTVAIERLAEPVCAPLAPRYQTRFSPVVTCGRDCPPCRRR